MFEIIIGAIKYLPPGQRFWVNWNSGSMLGGVYRDSEGQWFAYSEDVTNAAKDWEDALAQLLDLLPVAIEFGTEDYR